MNWPSTFSQLAKASCKRLWVKDAKRTGGMNHSCDSNLWMRDEVTVVARRAIAAEEELTIDYALQSGLPVDVLGESCRCGSPVCRGVITGNDWQLKELQERYRGHFSPFLNERIRSVTG